MKKLMVFAFFALSLGLTACGGNSNPLGSDDPFEDQPENVKNGTLKPAPKPPEEKPIGKDIFVVDGEGFADHVILQQNINREVVLTARSFFDKAQFRMEIRNISEFKGAKVTSTDGDASQKIPATIKFKWKPTASDVNDQVTVASMTILVYTTNLNHVYSYEKVLTVFIYREDYSAPEVINIQKLTTPLKEGKTSTFMVDVRDKDALASPYSARPQLMFLPRYTFSNNSIIPFMTSSSPTQDLIDSTIWRFTVTLDLNRAELTDSKATLPFMIAARSRFEKVSVPQPGEVQVLTSLTSLMTTAQTDLKFKKGAVNHHEFQIFDPKSEGVVTLSSVPNCAVTIPGSTCGCQPKKGDSSILNCQVDWNVPADPILALAPTVLFSAQNVNSDKSDKEIVNSSFNFNIILVD